MTAVLIFIGGDFLRYCLGVDVAAVESMYCLAAETGEVLFMPVKYSHTLAGFSQLLERLSIVEQGDISVIMESTSTYHLKVERFFRENTECTVIILNPIISKEHKRNLRKTKTDKEDCLNLIDIFFKNEYNLQTCHDEIYSELQFLSRQIQHLQEGATRTRNRLRQLLSMVNSAYFDAFRNEFLWSESGLALIAMYPHCEMLKAASAEAIAAIPAAVHQRSHKYYLSKAETVKLYAEDCYPAVDKDSVVTQCLSETALRLSAQQKEIEMLKERLIALASQIELYGLYMTVPGIGPYLSATLIAELKDIRRFPNHKKLIAFCGLDPTIVQSGKTVNYHGPISKRGNSTARKMLFYSVSIILSVARRTDPQMPLLLYYEKKRGEGKHHHACVVACCTKLLRILLAMSKQSTPYQ